LESTPISTNFRHNEQIRISPIFLINDKDEKIGSTSTAEALRLAREAGMDLVEVAPTARPPVCKIMDYGKWRYQQQKKEDKSRASARAGQLKELKLKTVKIGDHDLMIKINHAREFLKEGNKVQFTLQFKGREMAHLELGRDLFSKIKTELWPCSKIERDSKMEGRRMTLVLQPDNKPAGSKMPVPGGKDPVAKAGAPGQGASAVAGATTTGGPGRPGIGPGSAPMGGAGSGLNIPQRAAAAPAAGSPVAGSPVAGSPVAGSPVAGSPVAGSPVAGSSVAVAPAVGSSPTAGTGSAGTASPTSPAGKSPPAAPTPGQPVPSAQPPRPASAGPRPPRPTPVGR
jgi:translation initiation factor IF-3